MASKATAVVPVKKVLGHRVDYDTYLHLQHVADRWKMTQAQVVSIAINKLYNKVFSR